ncbi:MAG TPA: queuosine precursor transporter [Anaerolineaceae bacterium]|nr:queuosine precursor transporter [Anaerolineaceae bacterium]HOR83182.1 queuosine precursor transporter [Anaerolineaceae bacterium]HPL43240.1 queuosine precursor transporter [Anaerolineaceae bacterium]
MDHNAHSKPAPRPFRYLDIVTVVFTLVLALSNIASSAKLIGWGVSLGGVPLAFDAGTLFFPIAYIFGDVLTEVYGYQISRRVIWIGFLGLAFTTLMFFLIQRLPGETTWLDSVGQSAYDKILGGISTGGIVLASFLGYLGGSFSNAVIMALLKHATQGKWLWVRTIGSTLVGELVDTAVFIAVGALTRVFPWELFLTLTLTNYLFKVAIEVIMTPATYWVTNSLKKAENLDTYSDLSDLSPLSF